MQSGRTAALIDTLFGANGNTLTDSSGRSFTWDFENRLVQVVTTGSNAGTTTFKYDPFGRRIEKISPTTTSIFVYDADNLIEEANSSGAVVARYARFDRRAMGLGGSDASAAQSAGGQARPSVFSQPSLFSKAFCGFCRPAQRGGFCPTSFPRPRPVGDGSSNGRTTVSGSMLGERCWERWTKRDC